MRSCSLLAASGALGLLGTVCAASLLLWFVTPFHHNARLTRIAHAGLGAGMCFSPRGASASGWALELAREFVTGDDLVAVMDGYLRRGWELPSYNYGPEGFSLQPRRSYHLDLYLLQVDVREAIRLAYVDGRSTLIVWDYTLALCRA